MKQLTRFCGIGLLLVSAAPSGFAQFGRLPFPGSSPYPGGRGGVGLPSPVPGGGKQKTPKQKPDEEPLATFTGTLRSSTGKSFIIQTADSNEVEFHCSKKTHFSDGDKKLKASSLKAGDSVSVEARHAIDGTLDAVNVRLEHPRT